MCPSIKIDNCSFIGNYAHKNDGAAIRLVGQKDKENALSIKNSSFINNTGIAKGGAVYIKDYKGEIDECEFTDN